MVPCYKIQKVSTIDVFAQILFKECVSVLTIVESWEARQKSLLKTGQNPEFTKNDYIFSRAISYMLLSRPYSCKACVQRHKSGLILVVYVNGKVNW